MKRWLIMILAVVVLIAVVGGIKGWQIHKMIQGFKAMGVPLQTISTVKVGFQEWRPQINAVGSVRAERGADLSAEVAGIVDTIQFKSGEDVKAGQKLVELRDADDIAHLAALKAAAQLAELTYNRDKAQLAAQAISQAQLDTDAANLKSARAAVAQQQATLDKKIIRAPFAGHLGIRAVDPGQYLAPGAKIVTLQQLDPVLVDIYLPQQSLAQIVRGAAVTVTTDTFPGQSFPGEIEAIDPKVDTDTRNAQVRAVIKNPEHKLLPGMFAKLNVDVGEPQRYLTLPDNAITYNPYGETVFVVVAESEYRAEQAAKVKAEGDDGNGNKQADGGKSASADDGKQLVTKQVFVTVGPTRGDQVAILKGLKPGDEVVTSGQLKLKNGTAVRINNSVQPTDNPNPNPVED
ncbi:MAG: efflux RND transporter periplasmic adaptor subunit [Stenotrophobium sp.]